MFYVHNFAIYLMIHGKHAQINTGKIQQYVKITHTK